MAEDLGEDGLELGEEVLKGAIGLHVLDDVAEKGIDLSMSIGLTGFMVNRTRAREQKRERERERERASVCMM